MNKNLKRTNKMVMAALLFVNEFLGWVKLREINVHGKTWNTVNQARVKVYTVHPISYWKDALEIMEGEYKNLCAIARIHRSPQGDGIVRNK